MREVIERAESLAAKLAERAHETDGPAAFPRDDVEDLRSAGFMGLMVPADLGGSGAGFLDYVRVAMLLARGNASTALVFNMHAAVTGGLAGITEEVAAGLGADHSFPPTRERILRAAVEGAVYGVAISEPEAGSRLSELRTTYEPEGDGYRLKGFKSACSGAGHLDGYLVAARAAGLGDPRTSYFLVPAGPGLEVEETWDPLGMRATASNGMHLDVTVGRDALLGGIEGLVLPLAYAMPQWLVASYAAVYVGLAEGAVREAARYVKDRTVGGERGGLSAIGHVRSRLGRADAEAASARAVVERAAALVDERPGDPETNRWIYRAKLTAGDAAMSAASAVTEACGLGALRRGAPLERILRDARSGAIMPPSSDVAAGYLGAGVLGVDPADGRPW